MEQPEGFIAVESGQENNRDKDCLDEYDDDQNHGTHYDEELALSSSFHQGNPKVANYASKDKETNNLAAAISGGIDAEKKHEDEDVVGQLREQVRLLQNGLRQRTREGLEQQLRMAAKLRHQAEQLEIYGPSVRTRLLLAVLAGLLGWAPPLVLELHAAWTLWGCCRRRWNSENESCITNPWKDGTAKSSSNTFYFLVSVVDFVDGILDIVISLQGLLGGSCDDNENQHARKWALVLFCMTLAGRTLGGVFGVFYESIHEFKRECTYFLVELTIWYMEDLAAIIYLFMRDDWTGLVVTNLFVTLICSASFVFFMIANIESVIGFTTSYWRAFMVVPHLFAMISSIVVIAFLLMSYVLKVDSRGEIEMDELDFIFSMIYGVFVVFALCALFCWSWSLVRKTEQQPQRDIKDPVPISEDRPSFLGMNSSFFEFLSLANDSERNSHQ